jgi:hypothetical protein
MPAAGVRSNTPNDTPSGHPAIAPAIFLAAAMAAAGCTTSSSPKVPPIGPMITRPAGRGPAVARAEQRVHCAASQRAILLPAGFVAAAAVLCPLTLRRLHGPAHVVSRQQVADHGLAPLVAALRRPPEHLPPGTVCAAQASPCRCCSS